MPNFIDSVKYAAAGIRSFFATEKNGRIQGIIALIIILLSVFFQISGFEWLLVLGCIALVICLEMVNSAIEKLCNLVSTEYNPLIKMIKDISAGAVLFAAIVSMVIGLTIFLPYVIVLLNPKG
jgi:undecaprenol kinase/diacylglycerol kinase (ATP)